MLSLLASLVCLSQSTIVGYSRCHMNIAPDNLCIHPCIISIHINTNCMAKKMIMMMEMVSSQIGNTTVAGVLVGKTR